LILDDAVNIAPNLLAEDGSLGIRVTHEEFSRQMCYRFQKAIVSTSANISGEPSPANFYDISDEIKNQVDYIVSFRRGEKTKAQPSQIIKLAKDGAVKIIRG
jgi:L-threonylcarbamoyladenylate synthase